MHARIFQPARNAMQSGRGNTRDWVLEFAPEIAREIDALMGWTGSRDMQQQVRLRFETREAAEDYARAHGIEADVIEPQSRRPNIRPLGYGDNFATGRRVAWTH